MIGPVSVEYKDGLIWEVDLPGRMLWLRGDDGAFLEILFRGVQTVGPVPWGRFGATDGLPEFSMPPKWAHLPGAFLNLNITREWVSTKPKPRRPLSKGHWP